MMLDIQGRYVRERTETVKDKLGDTIFYLESYPITDVVLNEQGEELELTKGYIDKRVEAGNLRIANAVIKGYRIVKTECNSDIWEGKLYITWSFMDKLVSQITRLLGGLTDWQDRYSVQFETVDEQEFRSLNEIESRAKLVGIDVATMEINGYTSTVRIIAYKNVKEIKIVSTGKFIYQTKHILRALCGRSLDISKIEVKTERNMTGAFVVHGRDLVLGDIQFGDKTEGLEYVFCANEDRWTSTPDNIYTSLETTKALVDAHARHIKELLQTHSRSLQGFKIFERGVVGVLRRGEPLDIVEDNGEVVILHEGKRIFSGNGRGNDLGNFINQYMRTIEAIESRV